MKLPRNAAMTLILCAVSGNGSAAGPRQFNHDIATSTTEARAEASAEVDALLKSFVEEQKLSSVAGFVAQGVDSALAE